MFDELFTYPAVLRHHRDAPWAAERARYLAYRVEQGCARQTLLRLACELLVVARTLHLAPGQVVSAEAIAAAADAWARRQRRRGRARGLRWSRALFVQVATHWLRFLGRLREPLAEPLPWGAVGEEFTVWMQRARPLPDHDPQPSLARWPVPALGRVPGPRPGDRGRHPYRHVPRGPRSPRLVPGLHCHERQSAAGVLPIRRDGEPVPSRDRRRD